MSDTDKIIQILGLEAFLVLKKPIRGTKGITVYTLIDSLINTESIMDASTLLDYTSDGSMKQCIASILMPHFPEKNKRFGIGGNSGRWRVSLLRLIDKRHCYGCDKNLPTSYFGNNIGKGKDNTRCRCKSCHVFEAKEQKISIRDRTPKWEDLSLIRKFYNECPDGYHVDHIIPLRGDIVSGLHTLSNLQYLLASDNLKKNNTFSI